MSPRPGERHADDGATRELLGAWALDAVDDTERAAVEDLIVRDPDAEREARGLREAAGMLGAAVAVDAPEEVRAATLAAVLRTAQTGTVAGPGSGSAQAGTNGGPDGAPTSTHVAPSRPADPGTTRTRPPAGPRSATGPGRSSTARRPGRARLALTALVAVVALALPSTIAWQQGRRAAEAEARTDRIATLLASPGAQIATGTLTSGGEAVAVVTADAGLVTVTGATDPGADRVYQLWVMRDGQPLAGPTSDVTGGVVQISTDEFRTGDALALTVEPEGGSEQPTSEPVVVLAPA
jgi:hypothetical protein